MKVGGWLFRLTLHSRGRVPAPSGPVASKKTSTSFKSRSSTSLSNSSSMSSSKSRAWWALLAACCCGASLQGMSGHGQGSGSDTVMLHRASQASHSQLNTHAHVPNFGLSQLWMVGLAGCTFCVDTNCCTRWISAIDAAQTPNSSYIRPISGHCGPLRTPVQSTIYKIQLYRINIYDTTPTLQCLCRLYWANYVHTP